MRGVGLVRPGTPASRSGIGPPALLRSRARRSKVGFGGPSGGGFVRDVGLDPPRAARNRSATRPPAGPSGAERGGMSENPAGVGTRTAWPGSSRPGRSRLGLGSPGAPESRFRQQGPGRMGLYQKQGADPQARYISVHLVENQAFKRFIKRFMKIRDASELDS